MSAFAWRSRIMVVGLWMLLPLYAATAQETIKLRVADVLPSGHFISTNGIKYFMDRVIKETNGRVTFDYYLGEQLGQARDMLKLAQSGVADIGFVVPSLVTERMPLSGVAELPGLYSESCPGTAAYAKLTKSGVVADRDFKANGVVSLFAYVNAPYQVALVKRPLASSTDLNGLKLRSVAGPQETLVRALKAVSVRMAAPSIYESLSRGTLDGILFPATQVVAYDLQGLIKYSTTGENFGTTTVSYLISETRWAALPADVREIMSQIGNDTSRNLCKFIDSDTAESEQKMAAAGVKLVKFTDEDKRTLGGLFGQVQSDWTAALERRNIPAKAAVEQFQAAFKP